MKIIYRIETEVVRVNRNGGLGGKVLGWGRAAIPGPHEAPCPTN